MTYTNILCLAQNKIGDGQRSLGLMVTNVEGRRIVINGRNRFCFWAQRSLLLGGRHEMVQGRRKHKRTTAKLGAKKRGYASGKCSAKSSRTIGATRYISSHGVRLGKDSCREARFTDLVVGGIYSPPCLPDRVVNLCDAPEISRPLYSPHSSREK